MIELDVIRDDLVGLLKGLDFLTIDTLGFQSGEEAFRRSIVQWSAFS